ncbi:MAG: magnesium transporter [Candidatus Sumerlaeaceae bacterium]|nr:magnesium transporter [Candidatus Sumerlaeaceae bacterium]
MAEQDDERSWKRIENLVEGEKSETLTGFMKTLSPADIALAFSRMDRESQLRALSIVPPKDAADVIEDLEEAFFADAALIVGALPAKRAAAILDCVRSDRQADLLSAMPPATTEEILRLMKPDEARDARLLISYPEDTAGGMMVTEYLVYDEGITVRQVIEDFRRNANVYADYDVQYGFITGPGRRLTGVLRMRDILFKDQSARLADVMHRNPNVIHVGDKLEKMSEFFDRHGYFGAPVVDADGRLVGVVQRSSVRRAEEQRESRAFLRLSGIIGGEELRSMGLWNRSSRRLAWLTLNIFLNMMAASVIAANEKIISQVAALAVFTAIVSDMSGCAGSQAVAVSIRELTLGLIRPKELFRVLAKEIPIGVMNGLLLGIILGIVAYFWKGNIWLGVVAGGALAANSIVSVVMGGSLPLILKALKLDPALVSTPILTTITDMCGFFFVLQFAALLLSRLV